MKAASECLQSSMLVGMDLEEVDEPGEFKKRLYSRVDMNQFHLAAHLSDDAVAAGQFAQTIAVDEIHASQID